MKRKICFFIHDFNKVGGTERVTSLIANELVMRDYDVYILSCQRGDEPFFFTHEKIKLLSLEAENVNNSVARKIFSIKELYKTIKTHDFDFIVSVDITLGLYTLPIRHFVKAKIISWEQFNYYSEIGNETIRKYVAKKSDALIVLSKSDLQNYKSNIKKINYIKKIYNPTSYNSDCVTSLQNKTVLTVGRLTKQKGYDLLLKAWEIVGQQGVNWKLVMVGSGEEEENLKQLIKTLRLKNVEMVPFQRNVEDYYLDASLYVLSSRYEGFGLVLVEAQTKGLPAISFNCKEGPAEIIQAGVTGELVEDGNIEMLAMKLVEMVSDKAKLETYKINAIKNAKRFSIDNITDEWEELFQDLK